MLEDIPKPSELCRVSGRNGGQFMAEQAEDPLIKQELLELAAVCDEVADNIEDRMTAG